MVPIKKDGAQQKFTEIEMSNGEFIRATFIKQGDSWAEQGAIRIQIQQTNNHLRRGPEVPIENIPELFKAITQLLIEKRQEV